MWNPRSSWRSENPVILLSYKYGADGRGGTLPTGNFSFTSQAAPVTRTFRMHFGKVALFGVVLFCLLWSEEAQAGLTFLSPADMQKIAERQSQNKLRQGNMNRRGVEDDLAEEEIGVSFPLDMKMTMQEQFQKQRAAVQDFLYSLLSLGSAQDTEDKNENPQSQ